MYQELRSNFVRWLVIPSSLKLHVNVSCEFSLTTLSTATSSGPLTRGLTNSDKCLIGYTSTKDALFASGEDALSVVGEAYDVNDCRLLASEVRELKHRRIIQHTRNLMRQSDT